MMAAACAAVRCALLYTPRQVCLSQPCTAVGTGCYPYVFGGASNATSVVDCLEWCCQVDSTKVILAVALPTGVLCLFFAFVLCCVWRLKRNRYRLSRGQETLRLLNRDSVIVPLVVGPVSILPATSAPEPGAGDSVVVSDGIVIAYEQPYPHTVTLPGEGYTT